MSDHILKIHEQFADAVCSGKKTFELRREDDRVFEVGDRLLFRVIDEDRSPVPSHALNGRQYEITYVLRGNGLSDGHAALAIEPIAYSALDGAAASAPDFASAPVFAPVLALGA